MSDNKKLKKPSWLNPIARIRYDAKVEGAKMQYNEFTSQILNDEELKQYDVELPPSWRNKSLQWLTGAGSKGLPAGSGAGLVQSPYADIYTKVYGVVPISDMPKYRQMYRNFPDVQQAVEMQVNLAIGKGFVIQHKSKRVAEYLKEVCAEIYLQQRMMTMASDMLVYGNAYTEVLWDEGDEVNEQMYDYKGNFYTKDEILAQEIPQKEIKAARFVDESTNLERNLVAVKSSRKELSKLKGLKNLDPIYMRVRRDGWGNVFGYIQWMSFPPVLIDRSACIHIKFRPKSTGYESAYGTSLLMSLVKNTDLLTYFENDAAVWTHYKAVPPLTIKGGTPEKPYTTDQMKDLMKLLRSRSASSMIFVKGDVVIEEMKTVAADLHLDWWINYLLLKRNQALGVPSFLMGQKESGGRNTAEVLVQEFITRLQVLQEFIAAPIEEFVLRQLIDAKFGKSVPNAKIVWKPILEETPDMRAQRIIQFLQAGAITINEARVEMGWEELDGDEYDKPISQLEPATNPSGFPAKPGAGNSKQPNQNKVPKTTPESKMKSKPKASRSEKTKKYQLMVMDNEFREKMLDLVEDVRFELSQDDVLVKDVRNKYIASAEETIEKYSIPSYLLKKNDFELVESDKIPLYDMKEEILATFTENLVTLIEAKEHGEL